MQEIFLKILSMAIAASWMMIAVMLFRLLFQKAPKWITCFLWILVGLRLICPFCIESPFSVIPSETALYHAFSNIFGSDFSSYSGNISDNVSDGNSDNIFDSTSNRDFDSSMISGKNGVQYIDINKNLQTKNDTKSQREEFENIQNNTTLYNFANLLRYFKDRGNSKYNILDIITGVWVFGVTSMVAYLIGSYLHLRRKVSIATRLRENIWESEFVDSPFILGVVRPRIFIPYHMNEQQLSYVCAHENAHLKRRDHFLKPAAFLILSIYWFHPLVWFSYVLLCKDIELACDEKVVLNMDSDKKKEYLITLLQCSTGKLRANVCPLAFGEVGIKERVMRVKTLKKPSVWLVAIALFVCFGISACLLTSPTEPKAEENTENGNGTDNDLNNDAEKEQKSNKDNTENDSNPFFSLTEIANMEQKTVLSYKMRVDTDENPDIIDAMVPTITLNIEEQSFTFMYDLLSSMLIIGNYKEEGDKLICNPDKNALYGNHYVFQKGEDHTLIFLADSSSVVSLIDDRLGVEVKDGAVFELFSKESSDQTDMSDNRIEVKQAQVDLTQNTGADGAMLYYADVEKVIFGGYFGLFVYDKAAGIIVQSLDLEYIGCDKTQGDGYCEISVDKNGEKVYLHPINQKRVYIFDILTNTLEKQDYENKSIWKDSSLELFKVEEPCEIRYMNGGEKRVGILNDGMSDVIGDCVYSECNVKENTIAVYYPLFPPENYGKLPSFGSEDMHDIVKVEMQIHGIMYEITDEDICKKLETQLSSGVKFKGASACPFYYPMYITRSDGTVGMIWPATDSCYVFMSEKGYFDMGECANEKFWKLLDDWYEKINDFL